MAEDRQPVNSKPPQRPMGKMELPEPETFEVTDATFERVGIFPKIWAWANGKKMAFGIVVSVAGLLIPGGWGLVLKAVGFPLLSVGVGHKALKAQTKYGAKGEFSRENLIGLICDLFGLLYSIYITIKGITKKERS